MDTKIIKNINKTVYRRFPEMIGASPRVQTNNAAQPKGLFNTPTYVLTYEGRGANPNGRIIHRQVRVIANDKGRILRISTSR